MDLKGGNRSGFGGVGKMLMKWWPLVGVVLYSTAMGCYLMHVGSWDLSIPWSYAFPAYDDVWQLHLTKSVLDSGWILENSYLGAPAGAHWYINAAPQTSSLHSMLLWVLGLFIDDAVRAQQVYFLLNFPLIAALTYLAARTLKIGRIPSILVAVLFSFISYRFNTQFYSYLGNYFCIPLALIPVYWTVLGRFADEADQRGSGSSFLGSLFGRTFLCAAACIVVVVLSDGYYAFFTLLLLGFAIGIRILRGDWRAPSRLLLPIGLVVLLIGLATVMMMPLKHYQNAHREEFYPGGVLDPVMVKHPFEAEVYSTSLKMLVAPLPGAHRVDVMAQIGNEMLATHNQVRKFEQGVVVPLGVLGSVLLFLCFGLIGVQAAGKAPAVMRGDEGGYLLRLIWSSLALALFAFLCAIEGGLGTLIAFIYPSIRAYERFGVFLLLILYFGAAAAATAFMRAEHDRRSLLIRTAVVVIVAFLAHLDQIPINAWRGKETDQRRFLAERSFVQKLEGELPAGAMVYNYPYSQYLSDNRYYGWGAYGQIRLYLHSKALRWSNGSGKNTAVERWHERMAALPVEQLLTEMAAAGFKSVVVDRMVVGDDEYEEFKLAAAKVGATLEQEDPESRLAAFMLKNPGYRISYDDEFDKPLFLDITNPDAISDDYPIATAINRTRLIQLLAARGKIGELHLTEKESPEVFRSAGGAQRIGDQKIDVAGLEGDIQCSVESGDTVLVTLRNDTNSPWQLNAGRLPLTIGVNLLAPDGSVLLWDPGLRINENVVVDEGQSVSLHFPMAGLRAQLSQAGLAKPAFARFGLLQEGNAWSNSINCKIQVVP